MILLKHFLEYNSLDYDFISKLPTEYIANSPKSYQTTASSSVSMSVGVSGSSQSQYEINHNITPTYDKFWKTGHSEIDNYIQYSLVFKYNLVNFAKMSQFQKLTLIQLGNYLNRKSLFIVQTMKGLVGSRFRRGGQYVLGDYIENFVRFNSQRTTELSKYKIIPFLIELNGKPGIGKSTFVDFLCEMMSHIFPFYDEQETIYNRVNDKFWNGYKQQPVILYDDQNQNTKLLYNLDNEIIQLGSGQFVHPPMAFEKNTKFSSMFVVFTTNTRILFTTSANKGAISRRIKTYTCEPLSVLGNYTETELEGEKWTYDEDVFLNPFNLQFDGKMFSHVIFDFLSNISKQRSLQFSKFDKFYYWQSTTNKGKIDLKQALNNYLQSIKVGSDLPHQVSRLLTAKFNKTARASDIKFDAQLLEIETKDYTSGYFSSPDQAIIAMKEISNEAFMSKVAQTMRMDRELFTIELVKTTTESFIIEKQEDHFIISKVERKHKFSDNTIYHTPTGIFKYNFRNGTYAHNLNLKKMEDSWSRQEIGDILDIFYKMTRLRFQILSQSPADLIERENSFTYILNDTHWKTLGYTTINYCYEHNYYRSKALSEVAKQQSGTPLIESQKDK